MSEATSSLHSVSRAPAGSARPLREFDRSLPMALMRARESVMRQFRPALHDHGVTEQQWRVLRALSAADGPLSVGEVAERTHLLGPSLSRMLVTLTARGLVGRHRRSDDARRSQIELTKHGRSLIADVAPDSEATYRRIESHLGQGDLELLYELLERTASLPADDESAGDLAG